MKLRAEDKKRAVQLYNEIMGFKEPEPVKLPRFCQVIRNNDQALVLHTEFPAIAFILQYMEDGKVGSLSAESWETDDDDKIDQVINEMKAIQELPPEVRLPLFQEAHLILNCQREQFDQFLLDYGNMV